MITPLRDVVIIRREIDNVSEGGIQMLDSTKDPAGTETGVVVESNEWYLNEKGMDVAIEVMKGVNVLFLRKHAIVIKGHKDLVCVRYDNLLAVIT